MIIENISPKEIGLRKINCDIEINSYVWNECEEIDRNIIFNIVNSECKNKNVYLFISSYISYPIDSLIKMKGNWFVLNRKYQFTPEQTAERISDDASAMKFYGCCKTNVSDALINLLSDYNSCYLLVTSYDYDLEELVDEFVENKIEGSKVFNENIINHFIPKDNSIISAINCSGSFSINVFAKR